MIHHLDHLVLTTFIASAASTSTRATPGALDLCFLAQEPLDAVVRRLETAGIPIELGPVSRTGATGPIRSVYVRDPDGNLIEIAETVRTTVVVSPGPPEKTPGG